MDEPERTPAVDTKAPDRAFGWRWILVPLSLFVLSRAAIFTVAGYSLLVDPHLHEPHESPRSNLVVQGLTRWDTGWFMRIAEKGYVEPIDSNFFPLFPLMGRLTAAITGLSLAAALLLCANVCSLAALIVVYRIFLEIEGAPAAGAALALLVAWPFSFFQAAAYPESIMMLSTAAAVWLAMRGRHGSAGAALGLGILARHLTALGGLALVAQQIRERGLRPRRLILHRDFIGLLLPLAIAGTYLVFLQWRFGDWRIWMRVRAQWGNYAWWGLGDLWAGRIACPPEIAFYVALSVIPGAGALLLLRHARWRILAAFALGMMILLWTTGLGGLGRYAGSCWPAFLPLGALLADRRGLLGGLVCMMAILQGMMLTLYVHFFPIM